MTYKDELTKYQLYDWCNHPVTKVLMRALKEVRDESHLDIGAVNTNSLDSSAIASRLVAIQSRNMIINTIIGTADLDNQEFSFLNRYVNWIN